MIEGAPDIVEIIKAEGVALRKKGRHLWGLCPFHDDRTPSFMVDPEQQRFNCFGCGAHGDVIDLIQRLHNLSFKDALKHLGIRPGKAPQVDPRAKRKRELVKNFERWRKDTCNDACDLYNDVWHVLRSCRDMEDIEKHAPVIHELSRIQGDIEILCEGTDEQRFELYSTGI